MNEHAGNGNADRRPATPKEERFELAVNRVFGLPILSFFHTEVELEVERAINKCRGTDALFTCKTEVADEIVQNWINVFKNSEDEKKRLLAYDVVNLLLGELCARTIRPIPEKLLVWHGDVSRKKIIRSSSPPGRPSQKYRDAQLYACYKELVDAGFPSSRNLKLGDSTYYLCCPEGGTAIDVIGVAIQKVSTELNLSREKAHEYMGSLKDGNYSTLNSIIQNASRK